MSNASRTRSPSSGRSRAPRSTISRSTATPTAPTCARRSRAKSTRTCGSWSRISAETWRRRATAGPPRAVAPSGLARHPGREPLVRHAEVRDRAVLVDTMTHLGEAGAEVERRDAAPREPGHVGPALLPRDARARAPDEALHLLVVQAHAPGGRAAAHLEAERLGHESAHARHRVLERAIGRVAMVQVHDHLARQHVARAAGAEPRDLE